MDNRSTASAETKNQRFSLPQGWTFDNDAPVPIMTCPEGDLHVSFVELESAGTVQGTAEAADAASATVLVRGGSIAPRVGMEGPRTACFSGFSARGSRSTAIFSMSSIGQGFLTGTSPGSGGGGKARITGASRAGSGVMVITAGLAFTSFGGEDGGAYAAGTNSWMGPGSAAGIWTAATEAGGERRAGRGTSIPLISLQFR